MCRFRMLAAIVALLAAGTAGAYFAGVGPFAASRLDQARQAAARRDVDFAVKQYLDHLDDTPEDNAARLELAELLKPIDASSALDQLQKIPPTASQYPQAVWHIAHIATVGKMDALAEDALRKLDKARPHDAGIVLSLAELYCRTERYAAALPWARQAARLHPGRAQTWLLLAEVLDKLKRSGEMLEPLRKAVERDPDLYPAHANLAYALQFSGQPDEAEKEARWCLKRQPKDVTVRRWLAMILRDRGEHDAALKQIRHALASSPADVDCRIVAADLLLFRRDAEEAYNSLKPLYPTHSDRRDFLGSLARAAAMSGRREESHRYQREIVNLIERESVGDKPATPAPGVPSD